MKAGNLPHVTDIRGRGLMIGIELDMPYKEPRTRLIKEQHCFTGCSGTNVLRLLPPLCLSMADADDFISRLKAVLSDAIPDDMIRFVTLILLPSLQGRGIIVSS